MEISKFVTKQHREVLAKARETYGDTKQMLVSAEELCELAAVCTKYPRYDTKSKARKDLYSKAVDEVADVLIVLDHIVNIFGLVPVDITSRVEGKIDRLNRWLTASSSMEQTTIDRVVKSEKCSDCLYRSVDPTMGKCKDCGPEFKNYKHTVPCDTCKHRGNFLNLKTGGRCLKCLDTDGSQYEPKEE